MTTNFFVVQAQRDLRDAQNTELRALADYRKSLVNFERSQQAPAGGGGGGNFTRPPAAVTRCRVSVHGCHGTHVWIAER